MADFHLTSDFLRALHEGERDPGDLVSLVMSHLFDLCPECETAVRLFQKDLQGQGVGKYEGAFGRAREAADQHVERVAHERHDASQALSQLLALKHPERVTTLKSDPQRYASPALGVLLVEKSISSLPGEPGQSLEFAQLARSVFQHCEMTAFVSESYARATAYVANAWRVQGHLLEAKDLFGTVRFLLRELGGGDRRVAAEVDLVEGALCRDLRSFQDATRLQRRAAMIFVMEEDREWTIRSLLGLAVSYRVSGSLLEAISTVEEVLELLPDGEVDRTVFYARHLLADCLCDAGLFEEADGVLAENRPLYAKFGDPLSLLRLSWVEGKIAKGLGDTAAAESYFLAARDGFRSRKIAYDSALVSLELAALYLEGGRSREVRALAAEMVQVFQSQEVHREALAALMLFEDAARLERATLDWVQSLSRYLIEAQRDPFHVFQSAS